VYEDDRILVVNKPAGLSVMGERHETDLVRLARDEDETLYPVHRIDKVTSGALLLAKDLAYHGDLTRQFNRRTVEKVYLAVTRSTGLPERGTIELPLSVGRKNRVRVAAPREAITGHEGRWSVPGDAVFTTVRTYPSTTTFVKLWDDGAHTLLEVHPLTGRRHQIRVHLAWIGHPIEGDPLFDKGSDERRPAGPAQVPAHDDRTYLHSWRLSFDHDGARRTVEAPPGPDFRGVLPASAAGVVRALP
jgi:tRNA pseudouridine32 synthase/23S rRNA pseudouridine746 synthase/23S rRNA pseudouridine1911/1915/1917 synthase